MKPVEKAAELVRNSKHLVVLTGAGISVDSGIPDFRGPNGLWKRVDPSIFEINYFYRNPGEAWRLYLELAEKFREVQPNPAHYAIASLESKGFVKAVITQNIDGLHQKAGSKNVIELHGNGSEAICLSCGRKYSMDTVLNIIKNTGIPPKCPECGGILKPNVIFFGEQLPLNALNSAFKEAEKADVMLVIGSSLIVTPAAHLPLITKENGGRIIIINLEPTRLDHIADVIIRGRAAEIVPKLTEKVLNKQ